MRILLFIRKPPVVTKTGKRRGQLAKGAAASLLSSASKWLKANYVISVSWNVSFWKRFYNFRVDNLIIVSNSFLISFSVWNSQNQLHVMVVFSLFCKAFEVQVLETIKKVSQKFTSLSPHNVSILLELLQSKQLRAFCPNNDCWFC